MLERHLKNLRACTRCSDMKGPPVVGYAVQSRVMLVGQAPGDKEPLLGKPFAWTAGKTLFRWLEESCGLTEEQARTRIYFAAVCRCFPGKKISGGDRVPTPEEVANCSAWLVEEMRILRPALVVAVGRLAIGQFIPMEKMETVVGKQFQVTFHAHSFDLIPLPHPSGASSWPHMEPGKTLLRQALGALSQHPAMTEIKKQPVGCELL